MKIFKINKHIEIVCRSEKTRCGFRHLATLMKDGKESASGKCTYQNRTWERYEFQSVLKDVLRKADLTEKELKSYYHYVENYKEDDSAMKAVMAVAKLGDLFCDTKKSKNDWKKRMLKAGLGNQGLIFPEDWDTLSEEDKESRLNKSISFMEEK